MITWPQELVKTYTVDQLCQLYSMSRVTLRKKLLGMGWQPPPSGTKVYTPDIVLEIFRLIPPPGSSFEPMRAQNSLESLFSQLPKVK